MNAHFRFGFFVAAALAPDALLAGASLVAGFAASLLLPANAPLLPFLGSVADRFRPSLDPAVPFSTLFDERPLLSVVFFAAAFVPLIFATLVAAFFKLTGAAAFAGAVLFFSLSVLLFLEGDFELYLNARAALSADTLDFSIEAVLAVLGGETEVLLLVTITAGVFFAAGTYFLVSSLACDVERLGFFSTGFAFSTTFFSAGLTGFSTTFFSTGFAFSDTFLATTAFLAGYLGGDTEDCFFVEDTTVVGLTGALAALTLVRGLERERGATDADLLALTSFTSAFLAALTSRLRRGALGGLLLLARTATTFFSTFLGASLRLGAVTLLCNFLGGDAIFFDDLAALSTIILDAFSVLGGDTAFLGADLGARTTTLGLDWLRLARRTGDAVAAAFFSGLAAGALKMTAFLTAMVADFLGASTILAAAGF